MLQTHPKKDIYIGIALAVLATVIWSGNFIISRGVNQQIGPVSLAFYRWVTATVIIAPFAWKKFKAEKSIVIPQLKHLAWVALSGIALFNTFVYVAGHYTTAINLALIGTTSSPIFATIMAVIFLKEKINVFRVAGIAICICGIIVLISKGSWQILAGFHFATGDLWVMAGALAFAVYNILVRSRPQSLSALNFLFVIFAMGTCMLFPFYLIELFAGKTTQWSWPLFSAILYLGAGTSVAAFLCWNIALHKLGAGRTVLFGNLIPIFSTFEAVVFLGEEFTTIHLISGALVIIGLVLANTSLKRKSLE